MSLLEKIKSMDLKEMASKTKKGARKAVSTGLGTLMMAGAMYAPMSQINPKGLQAREMTIAQAANNSSYTGDSAYVIDNTIIKGPKKDFSSLGIDLSYENLGNPATKTDDKGNKYDEEFSKNFAFSGSLQYNKWMSLKNDLLCRIGAGLEITSLNAEGGNKFYTGTTETGPVDHRKTSENVSKEGTKTAVTAGADLFKFYENFVLGAGLETIAYGMSDQDVQEDSTIASGVTDKYSQTKNIGVLNGGLNAKLTGYLGVDLGHGWAMFATPYFGFQNYSGEVEQDGFDSQPYNIEGKMQEMGFGIKTNKMFNLEGNEAVVSVGVEYDHTKTAEVHKGDVVGEKKYTSEESGISATADVLYELDKGLYLNTSGSVGVSGDKSGKWDANVGVTYRFE